MLHVRRHTPFLLGGTLATCILCYISNRLAIKTVFSGCGYDIGRPMISCTFIVLVLNEAVLYKHWQFSLAEKQEGRLDG